LHDSEHYVPVTGRAISFGSPADEVPAGQPDPCGESSIGNAGEAAMAFPGSSHTGTDGGGLDVIPAPSDQAQWLELLAQSSSLHQLGIALAWGIQKGHSFFGTCSAEPLRPSVSKPRSGGLFPLPVAWPDGFSEDWQSKHASGCSEFSTQCWVTCACVALNSYYGCDQVACVRRPGKVHRAALENLRGKIQRFLKGDSPGAINFLDVVDDLKKKRVSYTGEEVSQPFPLSPEQIVKSLPPLGHGGCIDALDFLVGRTKFLLENPRESLLPVRERETGNMQAKVHIKKGEEFSVFKLLETRGVIDWIPAEEVYRDELGKCLNGLFGVVKPGKFTPTGEPVLRVIMNLIPANRLFQVICGDVHLLPHGAAWLPLMVEAGEYLHISQGDMSAAFYLFAIPKCWQRYMSFAYRVDGLRLGREAGRWFRPACRVLPMGWNSSVGVMQMISRQILLGRGLPQHLELHKGRAVPQWFTKVVAESTASTSWWQVYLDNFMSVERSGGQYQGMDTYLQKLAMEAWHDTGVLTAEDKQLLGATEAVELGIRLDGREGLLGGSPERILRTCFATIYLMRSGAVSRKAIQMVLGRWVFVLQFRRAAMGVLSRSWEATESAWPSGRAKLELYKELQTLLCLAPLVQTDLRCCYDDEVTCSDASEFGGAAAVARSLSWSGRSLVRSSRSPNKGPIACPILVISAFNGVGGAFRIYDILGVRPLGKVSIEVSKDANRVTRSAWPDVEEFHDINSIDFGSVLRWANQYPRAIEVHIWGGFPCVHLSRVRAYRRNLDGEGSNLFWRLLELIGWVQTAFNGTAKVKFCVENVASMDEMARDEISQQLEVEPVKLDPADTLPYNRPRLAWCSEELFAMEELTLWREKGCVRAYVSQGSVADSQWIRPGWTRASTANYPTFMKSIVRRAPPPFPAGLDKAGLAAKERWENAQYRFPPYQYEDRFLLHHPDHAPRLLDASGREILLGLGAGHTATCRSASDAKSNWTSYEDSRLSLCGDSFSIPSFAIMGATMCSAFLPRMKPSDIIGRLGLAPGASAHPSERVPMGRWLAYDNGEDNIQVVPHQLVQCLGLQVNHTGSDVRLLTGEPMTKKGSHGSMRAWWWQWSHLFKVQWLHPTHINFLEMKMIFLTLLWKGRDPAKINKRWLHLEDSMVCVYILTKGRTSSRLLQPLAKKIGALQLFLGSTVMHGHVGSLENPTDAASRK